MVPVPPWCQHLPTVLPYLTPQPPAAHRAAFTSCLHPHSLDPIYSHSYLCVCACVCVYLSFPCHTWMLWHSCPEIQDVEKTSKAF